MNEKKRRKKETSNESNFPEKNRQMKKEDNRESNKEIIKEGKNKNYTRIFEEENWKNIFKM